MAGFGRFTTTTGHGHDTSLSASTRFAICHTYVLGSCTSDISTTNISYPSAGLANASLIIPSKIFSKALVLGSRALYIHHVVIIIRSFPFSLQTFSHPVHWVHIRSSTRYQTFRGSEKSKNVT
jgi:hypothetical protein